MAACMSRKASLVEVLVFILIVGSSTSLFWQEHNHLLNVFIVNLESKNTNLMEFLLQTDFKLQVEEHHCIFFASTTAGIS